MPLPVFNHEFLDGLGDHGYSRRSFEMWERLMHSHGESTEELSYLRFGTFERLVDVIIYPENEA